MSVDSWQIYTHCLVKGLFVADVNRLTGETWPLFQVWNQPILQHVSLLVDFKNSCLRRYTRPTLPGYACVLICAIKTATFKQHRVLHTSRRFFQAFFIRNKRDMINIQLKILQMKKAPETTRSSWWLWERTSEVLQMCQVTVDTQLRRRLCSCCLIEV